MLLETEHSLLGISLCLPTRIRPGFRGALLLVFYVGKCSFHHGGEVYVGKCSFHHSGEVYVGKCSLFQHGCQVNVGKCSFHNGGTLY